MKARRMGITILREEARKHDESLFEEMGIDYEIVEGKLTAMKITDKKIALAMVFWDAWLDERNHKFVGHYKGIEKENWPKLALNLVDYLEEKINYVQAIIEKHFKL